MLLLEFLETGIGLKCIKYWLFGSHAKLWHNTIICCLYMHVCGTDDDKCKRIQTHNQTSSFYGHEYSQ